MRVQLITPSFRRAIILGKSKRSEKPQVSIRICFDRRCARKISVEIHASQQISKVRVPAQTVELWFDLQKG
jgi:hypothetical protein